MGVRSGCRERRTAARMVVPVDADADGADVDAERDDEAMSDRGARDVSDIVGVCWCCV